MEEPTREKFYEKNAWERLFVIGILIFFGGIPHMFGNNSDPELVESSTDYYPPPIKPRGGQFLLPPPQPRISWGSLTGINSSI
jgi:hypothetical protein